MLLKIPSNAHGWTEYFSSIDGFRDLTEKLSTFYSWFHDEYNVRAEESSQVWLDTFDTCHKSLLAVRNSVHQMNTILVLPKERETCTILEQGLTRLIETLSSQIDTAQVLVESEKARASDG